MAVEKEQCQGTLLREDAGSALSYACGVGAPGLMLSCSPSLDAKVAGAGKRLEKNMKTMVSMVNAVLVRKRPGPERRAGAETSRGQ
jgi:hypothetical protein